jgi:hypothetical protein
LPRSGQAFFLAAGQAFPLMTAPKDQLSLWPADVELTQTVDLNYVGRHGLDSITAAASDVRQSKRFNWAASAENPEQQRRTRRTWRRSASPRGGLPAVDRRTSIPWTSR